MLKEAISYPIKGNASVRLVQVTDPHLFADPGAQLLGVNTSLSLDSVLAMIAAEDHCAHVMLATGDISQDYSSASYENFAQAITPLGIACHYIPGNHDDPHMMQLHMQSPNIFPQRRILAGNWQVIMLDSTVAGKPGGFISAAELDFIDWAISVEPWRHVLLAMHHNPVLTQCNWLDQHRMANGCQLIEHVAQYPQVKGLIWGHVHQELDEVHLGLHGPIRLLSTPSTCIQFKPKSSYFALDGQQPGYRLLDLHPNGSILTQVYRVPGRSFAPNSDASGY